MKQFNHNITSILEAIGLDNTGLETSLDDNTSSGLGSGAGRKATSAEREFTGKVVDGLKKGEIKKEEAASLLKRTITYQSDNRAISLAADFVDILNQSSKSSTISTGTLRKLARALHIKDGALDGLTPDDQGLVVGLVQDATKMEV